MTTEERAERLLGQLHQWAIEAVEVPREERPAFIEDIAKRYYDDALKNGLIESQAASWRENVAQWLAALVDVIETTGGAGGGRA